MAEKTGKATRHLRGPQGTQIWWIEYFDAKRKRHHEKIGRREAAINLLAIRRSAKLEGRKLPPRQAILFRALFRRCPRTLAGGEYLKKHSRAELKSTKSSPSSVTGGRKDLQAGDCPLAYRTG